MSAVNPFTVTTTSFGTVSCCRRDTDGKVSYEIHAILSFAVAKHNQRDFAQYIVRGQKKVIDAASDEYPDDAVTSLDVTFDNFNDMWGTYKQIQTFFMEAEAAAYKARQAVKRAEEDEKGLLKHIDAATMLKPL